MLYLELDVARVFDPRKASRNEEQPLDAVRRLDQQQPAPWHGRCLQRGAQAGMELVLAIRLPVSHVLPAANASASSRRSFPQNISPRTKKVGAPKILRALAVSVCSRSRLFVGSL